MKKNATQPVVVDRMIKGKVPTKESGIEIKKTICSICNPHSHCGIDAYVKDGVIIKVGRRKVYSAAGATLEMQFPISSARSVKNEKCC